MEEERHDNHRDHILRRPLENAINVTMKDGVTAEQVAESILCCLSDLGMIQYAPKQGLKLLTPSGRILVALMERPNITMRELALYLGVTEAGVMKHIVALVKGNVIARTKVKGQNTYRLNLKEALQHPDITRFYTAIRKAIEDNPET